MMLSRRLGLFGGVAAALGGCHPPDAPTDIVALAPTVSLRLPDAAALGRAVEAAQMVQADYQGRAIAFEGQLSVTANRLLLACIDPLGRPLMTVDWSGRRVSARTADGFPTGLRPQNMLADIMLIYWPGPVLRAGLSNATLEEGSDWRTVRDAYQPLIRIEYGAGDPWKGTARYRSLLWRYTLQVQSVEISS